MKKKMRLFESENKNKRHVQYFTIKVLVVVLFSGAGGNQKTSEESISWRSPMFYELNNKV